MITLQQAIKIRHFKVRIVEAVAQMHTATADEILERTYTLADAEDEFDAFLSSITEAE